jgi:uncharacterized protein YdeI (YjbR/CyaY-like superfamily)
MRSLPSSLNNEVTTFLDSQSHPFRNEIEQLRHCILATYPELTETIKWNGPNYSLANQDRITMKIHPPKQVQLIFHCGAIKKEAPKEKLITDNSGLLEWKTNDRAVATFRNMAAIEENRQNLTTIIRQWLAATS